MNEKRTFIDFHCHPTLKPFGKSFPGMENSKNRNRKSSIWYYDRPNFYEKILNYITSLTKFTQSDFTTLSKGRSLCVSASLYPPEHGFFKPVNQTGKLADAVLDLATGLGGLRIDQLQKKTSYFNDLLKEYYFIKQLEDITVKVDGEKCSYRVINNYEDLELLELNEDIRYTGVLLSIEGLHVLDWREEDDNDETVRENAVKLKNLDDRIFFVTLAHHFYNGLCGHAKSLNGILAAALDQSDGLDTGMTDLGKEIVRVLLDPSLGRVIPIDVKHMSLASRLAYYTMLEDEFSDRKIPIVISHGAVTGYYDQHESKSLPGKAHLFNNSDINFYDFEIIKVDVSGGIFGLQLDERRIGSKQELKNASGKIKKRKIRFHRSKLLWNQIQHIAEVLDAHERFAWGIQVLGTDFDGIIDPLNGYWSAEYFEHLEPYLLMHAHNYLETEGHKLHEYNRIDAEEIIDRFFIENGRSFIERHYRKDHRL